MFVSAPTLRYGSERFWTIGANRRCGDFRYWDFFTGHLTDLFCLSSVGRSQRHTRHQDFVVWSQRGSCWDDRSGGPTPTRSKRYSHRNSYCGADHDNPALDKKGACAVDCGVDPCGRFFDLRVRWRCRTIEVLAEGGAV